MKIKYTTPFPQIANIVIQSEKLSVYEKMIYIVLCSHANQNRGCFPSYKTIAAECGCSERKAIATVKMLEEKNYVKVKRRKTQEGNYRSNLYEMVIPGAGDA